MKRQKYMYHKICTAIVLFTFLSLYSCDNFLQVDPKEAIDENLAITNKASLETAIRGLYRSLGSNAYYGEGYVNLGFVPSGDVIYNVNDNLSSFNFRADAAEFANAWAGIYSTINVANNILYAAPRIQDVNLSDELRDQILGEAHFVRALAYFDLTRGWGGVPLKINPTINISEDTGIERSSLAQTYAFVLEDLDEAERLLPATLNRVRATKYTVWALKSRFYLYNENWEKAEEYATEVIKLSGNYDLPAPFGSWFKNGVVQTKESIFELSFSAQNPSGLRTRMSLLSNGGEYRYRPGEPVINVLRDPVLGGGRVALLDSATQSGVKQYAGALYYRSPATDPSYVLRLAEQYLIRAEARAHDENYLGAREDINAVRGRAGLNPIPAGKEKEELLDIILEERRLEFLWEAHRYFDLARTGKLKEKIALLKPNLDIKAHFNLFPIPINEVELGGLTQNPDY